MTKRSRKVSIKQTFLEKKKGDENLAGERKNFRREGASPARNWHRRRPLWKERHANQNKKKGKWKNS